MHLLLRDVRYVMLPLAAAVSALAQPPPNPPNNFPPPPRPPAVVGPPPNGNQVPAVAAPLPNANTAPDESEAGFGRPLANLPVLAAADFVDGQDDFKEAESAATGLGPVFNNVSCVACHARPSVGGASGIAVTRFGRSLNGVFDPLTALGGTLLHERSTLRVLREVVPTEANVTARRQTTPLYGLGLVEAIEDATILANAARPKFPGVQGRVAMVRDLVSGALRVGRFGWKAQHATLLAFSADAYVNEMGITNRFFPRDIAPNGNIALLLAHVPAHPIEDEIDPVTQKSGIDKVTDYMRLLAPPPTLAATPASRRGERVFTDLGCASCHTPSLTTGRNALAALDRQPVALYSDLLLHDMGSLGDGIAQGAAGVSEMRTAPLWGLRASGPYLHDGRAQTVDAAIRAHEGEAAGIRDRYVAASEADRADLISFLRTL